MLLGALHVMCALGLVILSGAPPLLAHSRRVDEPESGLRETVRSPYLRTIAAFVLLTSASSAIIDFLLKSNARASFGTGSELLRFFSLFYGSIQVLSFVAQFYSMPALKRLGIDGSVNSVPAAVGTVGAVALLIPVWPLLAVLRGVDSVLHNSIFPAAMNCSSYRWTSARAAAPRPCSTSSATGSAKLPDRPWCRWSSWPACSRFFHVADAHRRHCRRGILGGSATGTAVPGPG